MLSLFPLVSLTLFYFTPKVHRSFFTEMPFFDRSF